jgi:hypothetical protein
MAAWVVQMEATVAAVGGLPFNGLPRHMPVNTNARAAN